MKPQIIDVETADSIAVESPYSKTNNEVFRSLAGKFDRDSGRWILPRTEATKCMIEKLFGEASSLVTIQITQTDVSEIDNQWQLGGYVVATRRNRDDSVSTPAGVQLADGNWTRTGGSQANPRVTGTDLRITIVVRRSYAERENLTIIASHDQPMANPLAIYSDSDITDEFRRRGLTPNLVNQ